MLSVSTKREYCFEESLARGAFSFSTNEVGTPVNARGRDFGQRAFGVLGLSPQGFATILAATPPSLFREIGTWVRNRP